MIRVIKSSAITNIISHSFYLIVELLQYKTIAKLFFSFLLTLTTPGNNKRLRTHTQN